MPTLADIRTEVKARGFDYVTDARVTQWINDAYQEIAAWMPWPFLETETTGASPLTIADLGLVLSVTGSQTDVPLEYVDRRNLLIADDDLSETGTPTVFWRDDQTIHVHPGSSSDTVTVRYIKIPVALSANGDTPVIPTRFHSIITDRAVMRAQLDNDMYDEHERLEAITVRRLDLMTQQIMGSNLAGPDMMVSTFPKNY